MQARTIAEQSEQELGGPGSVLVRQRRDHAELDRLVGLLESTSGAEQDRVVRDLCRLVFSHAFAEEAVLWPAVRRAVPDGEALTLRNEQEHQRVDELVVRLDGMPPDDPARPDLLRRVVDLLRADVRDEEDLILPRLQAALDARALRRLGTTWALVRRLAPTRPHPLVARRPPGNALSALPLTLLDRSRDALDTAARRGGPLAPLPVAASRLLALAAAGVERTSLVQRGEDLSTSAQGVQPPRTAT